MIFADSVAVKAFEEGHEERLRITEAGFGSELVAERQRVKLDRLWDRLADVPYYRGLPAVAERAFTAAPLTPKAALKADPERFLREGAGPYHKYYETSGTTSVPTPTPRLVEDTVLNTVSVASLWSRVLRPGDRVASLLPSDVAPVCDLVAGVSEYLGCTMLRCYPFSQGMCDWDRLEVLFTRYRPEHVFAAPGVLLQWTRVLKSRGRLAEVAAGVRSLMLLGEVSTPPLRARLAEQWGARVLDASYGSTETGTIAAACEHDRLHVLEHSHVAEVAEPGGEPVPAAPGAHGELVVTPLNNHARPLLRYGTGDLVTVGDGAGCDCGVALPVLTVHGRDTDGVALGGTRLTAEAVERIVYTTPGVTGYLMQLKSSDPGAGRLLLERDVDFDSAVGTDPDELCRAVSERFAADGVRWTAVALVGQLPQTTKAGGSQKNWKRTNVQWVD
ncbi:phenylacetate--CoA ligase family protein [Streptomyces sp. NPDC101191]|uniref:phenylacetate--CoA ligase family protein n=1 Tax=Streptomyces sp. NPDC101191 TaxID=3366126 RepID=UPI00380B4A2D